MSLRDGIQRFLDETDPKIFARGADYYRSGMVERLAGGNGHVTAEVSGSEARPYLVEISVTEDGEVTDWSCSCPYDWGPVCKHVAAALLALQEEVVEERERPEDAAKRKAVVQELVERAGKEQLAALVLERCWEDNRFLVSVLSELEDSGELELASIKELVRETIRANTCQGYIDETGCGNICAELDDVLDKARRRVRRGQWGQALEIARFVLLTVMRLFEKTGGGSLGLAADAALETVGLAADGLAESGGDREVWVTRLLETAWEPVFDGWTSQRYALLCRTAVLADSRNEWAFYDTLKRLSDRRWEAFKDAPRYDVQDKLVRYHIIRCAHGAQAARDYLKRNLDVDEFRLMLAREYIEEENYSAAERLCLERIEKTLQETGQRRPNQWQYLLYEIYRNWGQREKQVQQARRLALMGDKGFYQITKNMLAEDGRWAEEYPRFLAELKTARPAREYMEILAQENETTLLMEYMRYYRDEVFRYGGILAPAYSGEIYSLCAAAIREVSKRIHGRGDYQKICGMLRLLAGFGGAAEAGELIGELRRTYPRRPALLEELERVEREMAKRAGGA